jgi:hypothetical protein
VVVQAEVVKDVEREESRYVVDFLLISDQSLPVGSSTSVYLLV